MTTPYNQNNVPRTCRLCDQPLVLDIGPSGFTWMSCPRYPNHGAHWWSGSTPVQHDRLPITSEAYDAIHAELISKYRRAHA